MKMKGLITIILFFSILLSSNIVYADTLHVTDINDIRIINQKILLDIKGDAYIELNIKLHDSNPKHLNRLITFRVNDKRQKFTYFNCTGFIKNETLDYILYFEDRDDINLTLEENDTVARLWIPHDKPSRIEANCKYNISDYALSRQCGEWLLDDYFGSKQNANAFNLFILIPNNTKFTSINHPALSKIELCRDNNEGKCEEYATLIYRKDYEYRSPYIRIKFEKIKLDVYDNFCRNWLTYTISGFFGVGIFFILGRIYKRLKEIKLMGRRRTITKKPTPYEIFRDLLTSMGYLFLTLSIVFMMILQLEIMGGSDASLVSFVQTIGGVVIFLIGAWIILVYATLFRKRK